MGFNSGFKGLNGGTYFILRIKKQETHLILHEHDDGDDDDDDEIYKRNGENKLCFNFRCKN